MDGITPERIGNLHLIFLHLPIGFVVAAVLIEGWRWRRPSAEGAWLQGRLLAANAVATLLTACAGLVLASTGSYASDVLSLHRWAGVACAGLAIATWLAHARGRVLPARGLLGALLGTTIFAGHYGATLTHGESVTAWWSGQAAVAPKPGIAGGVSPKHSEPLAEAAPKPVVSVFVTEIQPILEKSCIECHGPKKARGRLRLDSSEAALNGGKSGVPAIVAGQPDKSELVRRIKLPASHEDFMPAGDKPALSAVEIAALEKWIAAGAPRQ